MRSQSFSITSYLKFFSKEFADRAYYILILITAFCILIFDLILPLGVAAGTPYVLIVFGSLWMRDNKSTYIFALVGLLFTFIGFLLSEAIVAPMETVIINRTLAALLIIITTIMVVKIKKANADISALKVRTLVDPLTQCKNRQAFEQELTIEILRDKRYSRSLSIAIVDIDHLHTINDTYSYDHGNNLIKRIVNEIVPNIRNSDILYRLEGGHFAILFTETNIAEAKRVGEAIRKRIAGKIEQSGQKVTVSIGIAALCTSDNKKTLCKRAENALFVSKRNGRNQVSTLPHIVNKNKTHRAAILSRSRPT